MEVTVSTTTKGIVKRKIPLETQTLVDGSKVVTKWDRVKELGTIEFRIKNATTWCTLGACVLKEHPNNCKNVVNLLSSCSKPARFQPLWREL